MYKRSEEYLTGCLLWKLLSLSGVDIIQRRIDLKMLVKPQIKMCIYTILPHYSHLRIECCDLSFLQQKFFVRNEENCTVYTDYSIIF